MLGARLDAELLGGSFSPAATSGALALRGPTLVLPARGRLPRLPAAGTAASFLDAREGSSAWKCPAGVERPTPLRAKTRRLRGRDRVQGWQPRPGAPRPCTECLRALARTLAPTGVPGRPGLWARADAKSRRPGDPGVGSQGKGTTVPSGLHHQTPTRSPCTSCWPWQGAGAGWAAGPCGPPQLPRTPSSCSGHSTGQGTGPAVSAGRPGAGGGTSRRLPRPGPLGGGRQLAGPL